MEGGDCNGTIKKRSLSIQEDQEADNKKRKLSRSLSFSFSSADYFHTSFHLASGSFSSAEFKLKDGNSSGDDVNSRTSPRQSHEEFQKLLKYGLKTTAPPRGKSMYQDMSIGVFETQGGRKHMEDRYEVSLPNSHEEIPLVESPAEANEHNKEEIKKDYQGDKNETTDVVNDNNIPCHAFFAVYDGHGGDKCVDFVNQHLHKNVVEDPQFKSNPEEALRNGILKTEKEFEDLVIKEELDGLVGTCICVALFVGNVLYLASVGDSAAILCRNNKCVKLTYPHNPQNPLESKRVQQVSGIIKNNRLCHPKWNPNLVNIAVTRSMGDVYFKHTKFVEDAQSGLIADPEIAKVTLTTEDSFVFMASDGYWNVMTPAETIEYILQEVNSTPNEVCQHLTLQALHRNSSDNVTCMLISLFPHVK